MNEPGTTPPEPIRTLQILDAMNPGGWTKIYLLIGRKTTTLQRGLTLGSSNPQEAAFLMLLTKRA